MAAATREQSYIGTFWNSPEDVHEEDEYEEEYTERGHNEKGHKEEEHKDEPLENTPAIADKETRDDVDDTAGIGPVTAETDARGDESWADDPDGAYLPGEDVADPAELSGDFSDNFSGEFESKPSESAIESGSEPGTGLCTTSSFVEQNKSVLAAIKELDARDAILKGILSTMQNQIFQLALRLGDTARPAHATVDTVYRTDRVSTPEGGFGSSNETVCADFL